MDLNNIKRNQLDYILTDMLPTELSERFTFFYFYEFLMTKRKELKQMNNFLISVKNKYKTGIMFAERWKVLFLLKSRNLLSRNFSRQVTKEARLCWM